MKNAACWIMLYGITYSLSEKMAQATNKSIGITAVAMLMYTICLLIWIYRSHKGRTLGLCRCTFECKRDCGYFSCLLVLPVYNLVIFHSYSLDFFTGILLSCVSIAEEVFFRGFLFSRLHKKNGTLAVWMTSVIFALAHSVNLIHMQSLKVTLIQMLCAFAVSIYYCAITLHFRSIFPSVIAHVLVNVTSVNIESIAYGWREIGLGIVIAIYFLFGLALLNKVRKTERRLFYETVY